MKLIRLSPEQFNEVAAKTRLKAVAKEMAFAVLVNGENLVTVAEKYGFTKQRVFLAVQSINKAYELTDKGTGIVTASFDMPENLAKMLSEYLGKLNECPDQHVVGASIDKLIYQLAESTREL